ncbi:MAG: phosphate/phosphite/phosphonate ABC transporter substrate-binding protein [Bacillota bacterium]|nr:phosphate/phosphite/phosphonate ABC transporter substrate-binding protein [Bacillota bacterium]
MLTGKVKRHPFLIILLLFLTGLIAGCQPVYPQINLKQPEDIEAITVPTPHYRPNIPVSFNSDTPYVRIAIAPTVSPAVIRQNYRKLSVYIPEKLEQPVELIFRSTNSEINQLIIQNLVDAALVESWSYVILNESDDIELLAVPQVNGNTYHYSYVIVSANSNYYKLEDLKNQKFIFTDPLSFPGKLYVSYLLAQMGETPDTFFSKYIHSYSNDSSIIAVAEQWVEGAAVDSLVYDYLVNDNPELENKIRIIETSPPIGNPPLIISAKAQPELKQKIKNLFFSMHRNAEGQNVLADMKIESFVPGQDEDYDIIRSIMNEIQQSLEELAIKQQQNSTN